MTITREARHLSGNDLGKHVEVTCKHTHKTFEGELDGVLHLNETSVVTITGIYQNIEVDRHDHITLTGTPTPAGLNLHRSVIDQEQP